MTQVSNMGDGAVAVNLGNAVYFMKDVDGDGKIGTGDLFVKAYQSEAAVTSHVIGSQQALKSYGDPHINDIAFSKAQQDTLTQSLDALFQDAKDGTLNSASALGGVDSALGAGSQKYIGDFQSDATFTLIDGKSSIEHDTVAVSTKEGALVVTDNIDINVDGKTYTIKDVWAGNGGSGQMKIQETTSAPSAQAIANASKLPNMHEMNGANVRVEATMFGEGTTGAANFASKESFIVGLDGLVKYNNGKLTQEAAADFIATFDGFKWTDLLMLLDTQNRDEDSNQPAAATKAA